MLVDVERNDLGRICKTGTVQVTDFMLLEKYSHVSHIVSNISGRLLPGQSIFEIQGRNTLSGLVDIIEYVQINTTGNTITVKGNDVNFAGIVTALKFSGPFTDLTINDDLIVSDGLTVSGIATFNNDVVETRLFIF